MPGDGKCFWLQPDWVIFMQQDVNQDSGAYNIRNHGSDSNTGYAKVEGNDQNKIQPGIDNTGCNQRVKRPSAVSGASKNRGTEVI